MSETTTIMVSSQAKELLENIRKEMINTMHLKSVSMGDIIFKIASSSTKQGWNK